MASLRNSLLITFASTNGATVVHIGVSIILARLLLPSEIGIFSITAIFVSIAHIFRDFGVAAYLQREKDLTASKVASAFGVLLTSSWFIAIVMVFSAPAISNFYQQPGVKDVMYVLAIGFLFIPFGAITNTLLTRDYRAKEQAYVYIAGTAAYAVTAISLAFAGFGYMSMAWANLANIVVTAIAFLPFRPKIAPWLPKFTGWGEIINFGGGAIFGNSLKMIDNAIPDLILGKVNGPYDVGIFSRAMSTANMATQALTPTVHYAALPYLARIHHANKKISDPLVRAIAYVTAILWPALAFVYIYAEQIVLLLYGTNWVDSISLVKILSLSGAATVPFSFTATAYLAIGRPYIASIPTIITIAIKLLLITLLFKGNTERFAWALCITAFMSYAVIALFQQWLNIVTIKSFLRAQAKSALITAAIVTVNLLLKDVLILHTGHLALFSAAAASGILWVAIALGIKHPISQEMTRLLKRKHNAI